MNPPPDAGGTGAGMGQRAVRGVFMVAAASWIWRAMSTLVFIVAAGVLGPRELGLLAVVTLASNVLMVVADVGVFDAVVYTRDRAKEAAETAMFVSLAVGVGLGLIGLLTAPAVASFYRVPDATPLLRAYALMLMFDVVGKVPRAMLTRELAFGRRLVPDAVPWLVAGPVAVGLLVAGVGVWSWVIGDIVRVGLGLVLSLAVLRPRTVRPRFHGQVASDLRRYAQNSLASGFLDFGLQNVDYLLVPRLLTTTLFGYYAFAFKLAILPFVVVAYPIAGVAFPVLSRLWEERHRQLSAFRASVRLGCAATFLLGGGLVALAPSAQVLGSKWAPAVNAARLLGGYVCIRSAAHLVTPLLQARGRPGSVALLRLAWLVLLGGLIVAFAHRGVTAVAVVQVAAAAVMLVAHVAVGRSAGIDVAGFVADVGRPALCAVVAVLVVAALRGLGGVWADDGSVATLLLLGTAFVAVYVLIGFFALRDLPAEVRQLRQA